MVEEYDYNDVLILPQKSNLNSRKNVQLEVTYNFIHSGQTQFSSLQQTVSESGKGMATPTKSNENNLAP